MTRFSLRQMNDEVHVEYIGCIVTLPIYWVLGNTIQYGSCSYWVIQYRLLTIRYYCEGVHIANIRIVYIISNTGWEVGAVVASSLSSCSYEESRPTATRLSPTHWWQQNGGKVHDHRLGGFQHIDMSHRHPSSWASFKATAFGDDARSFADSLCSSSA